MKSWLRHQPKRTCARRRPGKTGVLVTAASVLALTAFGSPARAALVYMSVSGVGLVYDMSANTAWLQDADLANQAFTQSQAKAWAWGLTVAGYKWTLPTVAEFTSLYTRLDPYGGQGTGPGDKYGAGVGFAPNGPNDYAANVQPEYWTIQSGVDFNFVYGYGGSRAAAAPLAGWAILAPETASLALMGVGFAGLAFAGARARRTAVACW